MRRCLGSIWSDVPDFVKIFTVRLEDNVCVEELRGDHLWWEGGSLILEDYADNVIPNVTFSSQLLVIS